MDGRSLIKLITVIGVIVAVIGLALFFIRKHEAEVAAQSAAQARYAHIENTYARVSYAMDEFKKAAASYDATGAQAVNDSQERHRLWTESPYDVADALTSVRAEQQDVQQLNQLASAKASSARNVANALSAYFGDSTLNGLLADITSASEAELKYLADWSRAAAAVNDILTARVNGRWDFGDRDDIESLYRASDEDRAISFSRWSGVASRLTDLQNRLRSDVLAAQPSGSTEIAAPTETPEPLSAATSAPEAAPSTSNPEPIASPTRAHSAAPEQVASNSEQQGPLAAAEVLPLLRATAALTVSTNPDGHTAYVSVPDTPANGTADADRIISGQMADGRWVVFVPLASGSPSAGDIYSLMWVWTDGRAQFVGEIPAENNGLGQLSTSVRNGEIYISWPVCCPRAMRKKVLTLDGIRLRPLSDTTS